MRRLLVGILDLLYPPRCAGCGAAGGWVCADCLALVSPLPEPVCPRCALPGRSPGLCRRCRSAPPPFERAVAAGLYEGVLRQAIRALKYGRVGAVAPVLGALTASALGSPPAGSVVVPVPSHRRRLEARGIDHARRLAEATARELGCPLRLGHLARVRATVPQFSLGPAARQANVSHAFATVGPSPGRPVVLVDDVLTTGATAAACAEVLLEAGASSVIVAVVARAVPAGSQRRRRL